MVSLVNIVYYYVLRCVGFCLLWVGCLGGLFGVLFVLVYDCLLRGFLCCFWGGFGFVVGYMGFELIAYVWVGDCLFVFFGCFLRLGGFDCCCLLGWWCFVSL